MDLAVLNENIGLEYAEQNLGCAMPVYLLYPDIPKYEFINEEKYFIPIIHKYFTEVDQEMLKNGDLIILQFKAGNHFCIYAGENLIFHCTEKGRLRMSRLNMYSKYIKYCFRYKGNKK